MEIRGVDGVQKVNTEAKTSKVTRKTDTSTSADVAEISREAKQLAEQEKIRELVNKAPDIRQDKIDEVKAKIERGDYNNEEVLKTVAERIMKALGL